MVQNSYHLIMVKKTRKALSSSLWQYTAHSPLCNDSRIHSQKSKSSLTLWFLPCLSKSEMMDLMCPSLMIFRASGLSTNTQWRTSRMPRDKKRGEQGWNSRNHGYIYIYIDRYISYILNQPHSRCLTCNYFVLNVFATGHCGKATGGICQNWQISKVTDPSGERCGA